MQNNSPGTRIDDIKDGTTNTILLAETSTGGFEPIPGAPGHTVMAQGRPRINPVDNGVYRAALIAPQSNQDVMDFGAIGIGSFRKGQIWVRPDGQKVGFWWRGAPYTCQPTYLSCFGLNNNWPGASSVHEGGGFFLMCDGSVHFISENLDGAHRDVPRGDTPPGNTWGTIWNALSTFNGGGRPEPQIGNVF